MNFENLGIVDLTILGVPAKQEWDDGTGSAKTKDDALTVINPHFQ